MRMLIFIPPDGKPKPASITNLLRSPREKMFWTGPEGKLGRARGGFAQPPLLDQATGQSIADRAAPASPIGSDQSQAKGAKAPAQTPAKKRSRRLMPLGVVKLDRMAIEEAGPDPERIAASIHMQLALLSGPVPIHQVAEALASGALGGSRRAAAE